MSSTERIAELEALLARIKTRAAMPRPMGVAAAPVFEPAPSADADSAPPATIESLPPADVAGGWSSAPPAEAAMEPDLDDVDVTAEVVEVDIDIDEPLAAESGAQLVAEQIMRQTSGAPAPLVEAEEIARPTDPSEPPQVHAAANEIEEPAPSSSPRPIAEAAEAYEEESSPRHTPPPESGKQVAAPSVTPVPARRSTNPPPSLEGHTLIGGWREPGLPQAAGPGPAVRVPAPAAPAPAPAAQAGAPPTKLTPEITRPVVQTGARVAQVQGPAPVFKPATFGELLDATLEL